MMGDARRVDSLAETLKRCGLAMSASEAVRMAKSIAATEAKVSKDFDNKRNDFEGRIERKRYVNPQDEINDLIEKTSFEKKQYFVPVAGFQPEQTQSPAKIMEVVNTVPQAVTEQQHAVAEAPQPVFTNVAAAVEDTQTLQEVITENAPEAYAERTLQTGSEATLSREKEETVAAPVAAPAVEGTPVIDTPKEEPEFIIREIKEEPPAKKEFKAPVEKIDLMSHFNFGRR